MTYVDRERADGWCHMWADTVAELHRTARHIGLERQWFRDREGFPHYDLRGSKRQAALKAGAVERPLRVQVVETRAFAERFSMATRQPLTNPVVVRRALHRLRTALPHLTDEDLLRIARMAVIEAHGPVRVGSLTPANARRLYELAVETEDGKFYDEHEPAEVGRRYHTHLRRMQR